ncbi:MAG: hypothetical protein AAF384_20195 [Pseudomonadota bacterium]
MRVPEEFSALEPFIDEWVLADSTARAEKRRTSAYEDIKAFYDIALALAPTALAYLSQFQLGDLDEAQENLLKLLLALAEIGPAVEWFGQNAVVDGFPEHRFALVEQLADTAAQE